MTKRERFPGLASTASVVAALLLVVGGCGSVDSEDPLPKSAGADEISRKFSEACSNADGLGVQGILPNVDQWYKVSGVEDSSKAIRGPLRRLRAEAAVATRSDGKLRVGSVTSKSFVIYEAMIPGATWVANKSSSDLFFAVTSRDLVEPEVSYVLALPTDSEPVFLGACAAARIFRPLTARLGPEYPEFIRGLIGMDRSTAGAYVREQFTDGPVDPRVKTLHSQLSSTDELRGLVGLTIVIVPPPGWTSGLLCPVSDAGHGVCIDLSYKSGPQRTEIWYSKPSVAFEFRTELDATPTALGSASIEPGIAANIDTYALYTLVSAGAPGDASVSVQYGGSATRDEVLGSPELTEKFGVEVVTGNYVDDEVLGG